MASTEWQKKSRGNYPDVDSLISYVKKIILMATRLTTKPRALGSTQPLKMSTRKTPGGKDVTTFTVPEVLTPRVPKGLLGL
jgi:hypothetical protein